MYFEPILKEIQECINKEDIAAVLGVSRYVDYNEDIIKTRVILSKSGWDLLLSQLDNYIVQELGVVRKTILFEEVAEYDLIFLRKQYLKKIYEVLTEKIRLPFILITTDSQEEIEYITVQYYYKEKFYIQTCFDEYKPLFWDYLNKVEKENGLYAIEEAYVFLQKNRIEYKDISNPYSKEAIEYTNKIAIRKQFLEC